MSERAADLKAAERKPGRRGRKAATALALGLLAIGALSACNSDAGSAAFVGSTRITQAQVNSVESEIPPAIIQSAKVTDADGRQLVLQYQTFLTLMQKYAKDNKLGAPKQADLAAGLTAEGQELGLTAGAVQNNTFAKLLADATIWENYLQSKTPERATTDADYRALFNELIAHGVLPPTTPYDQVKAVLEQEAPKLGAINDLQAGLNGAAKQYGISVNPRYIPTCTKTPCTGVEMPLLHVNDQQNQIEFAGAYVQLGGDASPAVLDSPAPATVAPTAAAQ